MPKNPKYASTEKTYVVAEVDRSSLDPGGSVVFSVSHADRHVMTMIWSWGEGIEGLLVSGGVNHPDLPNGYTPLLFAISLWQHHVYPANLDEDMGFTVNY
jgi:hypothetical protein